jgi:hypothetical protein
MSRFLWIFVIKYSKIWFIGIFYTAIVHKNEFGRTHYKFILNWILRKFISYFMSFIVFSTYFRSLYEFLELWKKMKKIKNGAQY